MNDDNRSALRVGYMLALSRLLALCDGDEYEDWVREMVFQTLLNTAEATGGDIQRMEALLDDCRGRWPIPEREGPSAEDLDFIRRVEAKRDRILREQRGG